MALRKALDGMASKCFIVLGEFRHLTSDIRLCKEAMSRLYSDFGEDFFKLDGYENSVDAFMITRHNKKYYVLE